MRCRGISKRKVGCALAQQLSIISTNCMGKKRIVGLKPRPTRRNNCEGYQCIVGVKQTKSRLCFSATIVNHFNEL